MSDLKATKQEKPHSLASPVKRFVICLFCLLFVTGCLREQRGEDQYPTNEQQVKVIIDNLTYIKDDSTDACFAILNNSTDGFRTTFTMAYVGCDKVGL